MLTNGKPFTLDADLVRRSLTCLPFDGQYQSEVEGHACGLAVAAHVRERLGLSESWLWSRWDGAHQLELGMDEVRKAIPFHRAIADFCSKVQQQRLYGPSYERVRAAAQAMGREMSAISTICTTRFHHSERRCYKNVFGNCVIFIQDAERALGLRAAPTPELLEAKSVVRCVQMAGTIDLLRHTKDLSLLLQTVNTLPWELEAATEAVLGRLE